MNPDSPLPGSSIKPDVPAPVDPQQQPAPQPPIAPPSQPLPQASAPPKNKRKKALVAIGSIVAVTIVGGVIYMLNQPSGQSSTLVTPELRKKASETDEEKPASTSPAATPNPGTPSPSPAPQPSPSPSATPSANPSPSPAPSPVPAPAPAPSPQPQTVTVTYTSSGFSPSSVTINNGDTVKFVNNSGGSFWPASNNHPSHTIYPEFDPGNSIAAGGNWSFTFTKTGTWGYHNHLSSSRTGTVTVQ